MVRQLDHVQNWDLGFEGDPILVVNTENLSYSERKQLMCTLRIVSNQRPDILAISGCAQTLDGGWEQRALYDQGNETSLYSMKVNANFLSTLGIRLRSGRDFSQQDRIFKDVIVNQAFMDRFNNELKESAGIRVITSEIHSQILGAQKIFIFYLFTTLSNRWCCIWAVTVNSPMY